MKSPKFAFKKDDIRRVVEAPRLKILWKKKVRESMRRQPIPDPIEYLDFHTRLGNACTSLEMDICNGVYLPQQPVRFLQEKSKGLCRQLIVPSVRDALVLQALSDTLWDEIRKTVPSRKSFYAPNDQKFSQIKDGHVADYGPLSAWLDFQKAILGFALKKKYVVVTDIANFYDFISYNHLRNVLADRSKAREHALDLLLFILSSMLWQPDYMPRVLIGLPQCDLDAPRLLAHCFLFEIDEFLEGSVGIDFARYMDDIDIGVNSLSAAKKVLRDLDLALQTRQIRLNSGKTKILNAKEAERHFKTTENRLLDLLSARIESKRKVGLSLVSEIRITHQLIRAGFRRETFTTGNGDKILKRLLNLAKECGAELTSEQFSELLVNWPSVRKTALRWWSHSAHPANKLSEIVQFVKGGDVIDHSAIMEVAKALVEARMPDDPVVTKLVKEILEAIDVKDPWGFYASAWVLSKYGSETDILALVGSEELLWSSQEHLSRMVAGLYPRFVGTTEQAKFEAILSRASNAWSQAVIEFHRSLLKTAVGYTSIKDIALAKNPSLPSKITHSKYLIILSLLKNTGIKALHGHIKRQHATALVDPFYWKWLP